MEKRKRIILVTGSNGFIAKNLILELRNRGYKNNVFGKWCRPDYNSVVATFCYNISHNLNITIDSPNVQIELVYIDDVINEMISSINAESKTLETYMNIPVSYKMTIGEIAQIITSFKQVQKKLELPNLKDEFEKKCMALI